VSGCGVGIEHREKIAARLRIIAGPNEQIGIGLSMPAGDAEQQKSKAEEEITHGSIVAG
jgi:hypothetical protein